MSNSKASESSPSAANSRSNNLIWIDLEMTGLNPEHDTIIEIATLVTDADLNLIEQGPSLAVHQSDAALEAMDEWCTRQHGQSGLTQRVRESTITEREAELRTLAFLQRHVDQGSSPMCGNSIGQDRRFLNKYMPELEAFFHYRNLDVSTLKELARRWKPEVLAGVKKQGSHLALEDIQDSINELRHYRQHFIQL
jgi:oligoribonuclease